MIHADDRRSFGEAVSLDDRVTQPAPELFGHAIECRSATDKRPELPSEVAMNAPENPPAMKKMFPFRGLKSFPELFQSVYFFQITLNFFLQRLQHARHGN